MKDLKISSDSEEGKLIKNFAEQYLTNKDKNPRVEKFCRDVLRTNFYFNQARIYTNVARPRGASKIGPKILEAICTHKQVTVSSVGASQNHTSNLEY